MICFNIMFFTVRQLQSSNLKEARLFEKLQLCMLFSIPVTQLRCHSELLDWLLL